MQPPSPRLVVLSLALAGLAATALLVGRSAAGEGGGEEPFSRAAWIARQARRFPFSGGVLPNRERLSVPEVGAVGPPAKLDRRATRPVRLSDDLLAPGPEAQPATQTEPYLAADPEDGEHLVAAWQENRFEDGGARTLGYAVTTDRGRRWIEDVVPGLTQVDGGPWQRASDPWVAVGPAGRVYFASLLFNETTPDNAIGVSISSDGGFSWEPPVEVFRSRRDFNDKEAVTVDTFPESRYYGRVYVAWDVNVVTDDGFGEQRLVVSRSKDDGATWQGPRIVRQRGANIGAVPRVGPDGTVYLVWAGGTVTSITSIYFAKSTTGGVRWSAPRVIAEVLPFGVPEVRTGEILPSFAVDAGTGDLYVAWPDASWTLNDQPTLIVSRDGGASWSPPQRVGDDPDDADAFTVAVAAAGGEVAVSYYSLRNDPARRFLVDEYVTLSGDGGRSFGPSIRATRGSFDVRFAAQAGGYFLGDYQGLAATERTFHLLWVDTRRYSSEVMGQQPDVWTARTRR